MNQLPGASMGTPQYFMGPPNRPLSLTVVGAPIIAPTRPTITQMAPHMPKAIEETIMPENFYRLAQSAPAQFSTSMGSKPKRDVPDPKPARIARANLNNEIQRKADQLRCEFRKVANEITTPTDWLDLHIYFDGYDLYVEGAPFLFFVLNHMSNENTARKHDEKAEAWLATKREEIYQWAGEWVSRHLERVRNTPLGVSMYDALTDIEKGDHLGHLEPDELSLAKDALTWHRALFLKGLANEPAKYQRQQYLHPHVSQEVTMRQPFPQQPPQHHQQHHQYPHRSQNVQVMPTAHAMSPSFLSNAGPHQGQMVHVHPVHPVPQSYDQFMENQRRLGGPSSDFPYIAHPVSSNDRFPDRPRGYSNGTARNGRDQRSYHDNVQQNRSDGKFIDRRMSLNDPRFNPSNMTSPVFIHNTRQFTPLTHLEDHLGAVEQQRIFSDPLTGKKGVSGDARQWQPSCEMRSFENQSHHKQSYGKSQNEKQIYDKQNYEKPPYSRQQHVRDNSWDAVPPDAPFLNDENARVNGRCSTYFYSKAALEVAKKNSLESREFYSTRTLYVGNTVLEHFMSHDLKTIFSQQGSVDAISFLYKSARGPAFVMFADESSLQPAINGLDNYWMKTGHLHVKMPVNQRNRADSESSQMYYPQQSSNWSSRRGTSMRQQSQQSIPSERHYGGCRHHTDSSVNSPGYRSKSPLTVGFQAQLSPPRYGLLGRLQQAPLGTIEGYSNMERNGNKEANLQKSQRAKKENTPTASRSGTPITTPRKSSNSQYHENRPKSSKNKKKGSRQKTSAKPTPSSTPIKSRSEMNFNNALSLSGQPPEVTAVPSGAELPHKKEANHILRDILLSQIAYQPVEETPVESSKPEQQVVQTPPSKDLDQPSINPAKPLKDKEIIRIPVSQPSQESSDKVPEDKKILQTRHPQLIQELSAKAPEVVRQVAQLTKPLSDALSDESFKDHQKLLQIPKQQPSDDLSSKPTKSCQEMKQDDKSEAFQNTYVEYSKSVHSETEESKEVRKSNKKKSKRKLHKTPVGDADLSLSISGDMLVDGSHSSDTHESPTADIFNRLISMASAASETSFTTADDIKNYKLDGIGLSSSSAPESAPRSGKARRRRSPGHSSNGSNNSQRSNDSIRKADEKTSTVGDNQPSNRFATANDEEKSNASAQIDAAKSDAPSNNLNTADWPELGPAKPSVSANLDDKDPAIPAVRSNNARIASIKVVPVIPLNMERHRQSTRMPSLGSEIWPVVKKCATK